VLALKVASLRRATPTTRVLRLALDGASFSYIPGQAAMLGRDGAELVPYSIASAPEETAAHGSLEFLVKVDPTARFGANVDTLRRGDVVSVDGPVGSFIFPDAPAERHFLFVAGGTGIAPLRSMIQHVAAARIPGTARLLYAARTRDEFAYAQQLRALERRGRLELSLTLTRDTPARWRYGRGRPGMDVLRPLVDDPETLCFLCGPPGMVAELTEALTALGVASARIRSEAY
jgi:benzoate/toluate 1,2-dioxygenase reductase component